LLYELDNHSGLTESIAHSVRNESSMSYQVASNYKLVADADIAFCHNVAKVVGCPGGVAHIINSANSGHPYWVRYTEKFRLLLKPLSNSQIQRLNVDSEPQAIKVSL